MGVGMVIQNIVNKVVYWAVPIIVIGFLVFSIMLALSNSSERQKIFCEKIGYEGVAGNYYNGKYCWRSVDNFIEKTRIEPCGERWCLSR